MVRSVGHGRRHKAAPGWRKDIPVCRGDAERLCQNGPREDAGELYDVTALVPDVARFGGDLSSARIGADLSALPDW